MNRLWIPTAMRVAPRLDENVPPQSVTPRHALLLNPFYSKDPHASFGKHVLTPTLALTSIAASTPRDWTVSYWDENLLVRPSILDVKHLYASLFLLSFMSLIRPDLDV